MLHRSSTFVDRYVRVAAGQVAIAGRSAHWTTDHRLARRARVAPLGSHRTVQRPCGYAAAASSAQEKIAGKTLRNTVPSLEREFCDRRGNEKPASTFSAV